MFYNNLITKKELLNYNRLRINGYMICKFTMIALFKHCYPFIENFLTTKVDTLSFNYDHLKKKSNINKVKVNYNIYKKIITEKKFNKINAFILFILIEDDEIIYNPEEFDPRLRQYKKDIFNFQYNKLIRYASIISNEYTQDRLNRYYNQKIYVEDKNLLYLYNTYIFTIMNFFSLYTKTFFTS